jgi:tetratricopeptide (TPR) repeat protein/CHAT domain-containing protein
MMVRWVLHAIVIFAVLTLAKTNWPSEARAQGADELASLHTKVSQLYSQGKYAEAIPIAERYVSLAREKYGDNHTSYGAAISWLAYVYQAHDHYAEAEPLFKRALAIYENTVGPDHPDIATALNNLARLYLARGRSPEAEPLYKRALAISEKVLGPENLGVGQSLNNLANLYDEQGRYTDAEPLYRRALAISEKALGPDHTEVATALDNLAAVYRSQGRYSEAEPLYKRAIAINEKVLGPEHPGVGQTLNGLANLYNRQGRYPEAEPLYKRALAISEKALGPDHTEVAKSMNNIALLYESQGRYAEAEPLYKRALAIWEKALGPEHRIVATALNNLALLYEGQWRYIEAEPLYIRSLAIDEATLGRDHPNVGTDLNNLAWLYFVQGRYAEAEPLYKRSLTIKEKALGPEHPSLGTSLDNLGLLYDRQGRYAEAEPLLKRAYAIRNEALRLDHPDVGHSLNNLALLYFHQGRNAEAEPLYKRALAIYEKTLGPEHPQLGTSLDNLARVALAQRDWPQAAEYWRRATKVIERRIERGLAGSERSSFKGEAVRNSRYFYGLVKMIDRLAPQGHADRARLGSEMFEKAQWAQASEAGNAISQMAARGASGNAALASLVRERQNLVGEWQIKDKQLITAKSEPPAKRNTEAEKVLSDRLTTIDSLLKTIDVRFANDFPKYASLASPKPASVAEVQAVLQPNEALVLIFDTYEFKSVPEETFIWVVTKGDMRWVKSELGTKALTESKAALRCGLDRSGNWERVEVGNRWQATNETCKALRPNGLGNDELLPFDLGKAHALYKALFGDVADLIAGKSLLVVPSGPLTQLPFHVLLTARAEAKEELKETFKGAPWLAKTHTITVLPAVSSLIALREHPRPSLANRRPFLGIGNPLLEGDPKDEQQRKDAALARRWQSCKFDTRISSNEPTFRKPVAQQTRGLANPTSILRNAPLPETANELCTVAEDLKANRADVLLGALATETEIKRRNANNELANYRVVHFATHGAVAGDFRGTTEPGLLLTPPETASDEDDGYLSASEISALRLDADWVILSACNTAAGGAQNAEALSGLARAFFYAGARALLVSHWSVNSYASEGLITTTQSALLADDKMGRAEALRRVMLRLITTAETAEHAHPAYWAPFVVVGEGGTGR